MVSPSTSTQVTSRSDIPEFLTAFDLEANMQGMIGLKLMPQYDVQYAFGPFDKIELASLLRRVNTARASGGQYSQTDFKFTQDSYKTAEHGVELPLDDRNMAIYKDTDMGDILDKAVLIRNQVLSNLEQRVAALAFDTNTFTPTSVTNEWDDPVNATPVTDVEAAVQRGYAKGFRFDTLAITWKVYRNLRHCDQIIDRINSGGAGQASKPEDITTEMLARVFALRQVLVGDSQYNSADEGQTVSLSPTWSAEYAFVTKCASGPSDRLVNPCFGRTFHYTGDGSEIGGRYETYRDESRRSEILRLRMETHEKVLYSTCGELLDNITT